MMSPEEEKALYENLSWLKSTEPMDGLLGETLLSIMGLVPDKIHTVAVDPEHRKQARSVTLRWLRDGDHLPERWKV